MMISAPPTVNASAPSVAPFTKPRRPMFAIASPPGVIFFLCPENVGAFPASQQDGNGANDAFALARSPPLDLDRRGKYRLPGRVAARHDGQFQTHVSNSRFQTQVR